MNPEPNHQSAKPVAALPLERLFADATAATLGGRDGAAVLRPGFVHRLSARVQSWLEIPYGYQDETGFHYGRPEWDRDRAAAAVRPPDC